IEGDDNQPLVRLQKIVKTYSNAAGDFTVLKGIDAHFYKGEFVGVIGKSGSGKSTLINMITGIDRPTSGEIYVGDTAVHSLTENQMAIWRGRTLGIVFQFFQLLPMLTLMENLMLPMDFCNMYTPAERKERAMQLLERVEMADHANKLPTAISGGQQQRVAIARAMANDPPILIADEPTGNLDSKTANSIFEMFEELVGQGKTIIMVTHDSSMARRVSRTMLIADGEVVNEYVARALPQLNHQQMLKASHNLTPMKFEPGSTILRQDGHGDDFYIITKGMVEVALKRPGATDVVVTRLGPGQYFGEVELMRGGKNIATIRPMPGTDVEVIALDRATFNDLLSESDPAREALAQIVETRVAENVAAIERIAG
ncbi:MAG: ATP-binding cassette domain-containing protein, partial [Desulfofustis sp.]|nr:ATP-binding cassette domain-containing protein [Desulfofustis sp.]